MKVFLTGATGQIGSAVLRRLLAGGHEVTCLVRSDEAAATVRAQGAHALPGDLSNASRLRTAASQSQGVIHTAFPWDETAQAVETAAVGALAEGLTGFGRVLVVTSGAGLLAPTGPEPLDETATPPRTHWRHAVERAAVHAYGVRGVVIRPGLVYGPNGHRILDRLVERSRAVGAGVHVGDGTARWATVHIEDLAALYVLALETPEIEGILHAASGEIAFSELAAAISRHLGFGGVTETWPVEDAVADWPGAAQLTNDIRVSARRALDAGWRPSGPALLETVFPGA